jgi:hypothetical protein
MSSIRPDASTGRLPREVALAAHAVLLAFGVGALLSFASSWALIHGFSIDDAWIHQAVARTFAQTGTLGYAPGQFGAGATSYLWAALLAANYRWLHADPVLYTLALNVAFYLGTGQVLLAMTLRAVAGPARALVGAAEAVFAVGLAMLGGNCIWFAFSGMEAMLLVFLSTLAIARVTAERTGASVAPAVGAGTTPPWARISTPRTPGGLRRSTAPSSGTRFERPTCSIASAPDRSSRPSSNRRSSRRRAWTTSVRRDGCFPSGPIPARHFTADRQRKSPATAAAPR